MEPATIASTAFLRPKAATGVLGAIGNTPLVELNRVLAPRDFRIFAKLESLNPAGSIKDRSSQAMIRTAMREGRIDKETTIVESSSGNMGIGLAQVCRYYGLSLICVIDSKTTAANQALLKAYGACLELVEEPDPTSGEFLPARLARVQDLLKAIPNSYWPNQYANLAGAEAMSETMAEIVEVLGAGIDYVFCSTSTCSTLRGCAEYIRCNDLPTQIVAVDACGSAIFGSQPQRRLIPGHGSGAVPPLFEPGLANDVVHVSDSECVAGCWALLEEEALLLGGSSGGLLAAVHRISDRMAVGSTCAMICADRGDRYLGTVYSPEWVQAKLGWDPRTHSLFHG